MPNANMNVLNALASLKRADPAAYDSLLAKLNIDRWQDVKEADADAVILECHARTSGITLSDAEAAAELGDGEVETEEPSDATDHNPLAGKESNPFVPKKSGSVRDRLMAMGMDNNAKMAAKATDANKPDLADVAGDSKTVAGKLDAMGKFANAARKVKAE